jgi:hypothetical protein
VTAAAWARSATTTGTTPTPTPIVVAGATRTGRPRRTGGRSNHHRYPIGAVEVGLVSLFDLHRLVILVEVTTLDQDGALI